MGVVGGEPVADLDEGEVLLALLVRLEALLGVADDEERAADLARRHAALVDGVLHLHHELLALAAQRVRLRHRLVRTRDLALLAEALRARDKRRQLRVDVRHARRDLLHRQLVRVLQRHRALRLQLRHLLRIPLQPLLVHVVQNLPQKQLKLPLVPQPPLLCLRQALEHTLRHLVVHLVAWSCGGLLRERGENRGGLSLCASQTEIVLGKQQRLVRAEAAQVVPAQPRVAQVVLFRVGPCCCCLGCFLCTLHQENLSVTLEKENTTDVYV